MIKKEKIEILTDAYKEAEELFNEAYGLIKEAHDETEVSIDYRIQQEFESQYMGSLAQEIIDREEAEGWADDLDDDDEEEVK